MTLVNCVFRRTMGPAQLPRSGRAEGLLFSRLAEGSYTAPSAPVFATGAHAQHFLGRPNNLLSNTAKKRFYSCHFLTITGFELRPRALRVLARDHQVELIRMTMHWKKRYLTLPLVNIYYIYQVQIILKRKYNFETEF